MIVEGKSNDRRQLSVVVGVGEKDVGSKSAPQEINDNAHPA